MLIKLYDILQKNDLLSRLWIGKVVNNNDPKKLGRIKVQIPPLFQGIPTDKLPWISPVRPILLGGKSDTSSFSIPELNSYVIVKFEKSIYNAYYLGEIQSLDTHQSLFNENYPFTYGFLDSTGTYLKINKQTKVTEFYHTSGTKITIDAQGNVTINIPSNQTITVGKDSNITIQGNCNISVSGNTNISSGGDITISGSSINLN